MCEITKKIICAAMAADETATAEERQIVADALAGDMPPLTVSETAERLGVSRPTVYALLRAGKLTRVGRRVSARSLAKFFEERIQEVVA